ncbi:hypothetical protein [Metallosphaera sp.]|uniref:hypothetical protein n=1 Tax=Metallosphaera sp. TaxID=2020860 RepID=UPI00317791F0
MAKVSPSEFAEKWSRNLGASVEFIRRGVEKTSVAPSAKAIEAKEKMKRKLVEAIDKGVWENALKKYTLDQWKKDMIEKGLPRIADGADKARPKVEEFAAKLLPYIDAGLARIKELPSVTLEDSIRRATEWIRYMSQFRKS